MPEKGWIDMIELAIIGAAFLLTAAYDLPRILRDRKVRKGNERAGLTWVGPK